MRLSIFLTLTALVAPAALGSQHAVQMITRDPDARMRIAIALDSRVVAAPARVEEVPAPTGGPVQMQAVQLPLASDEVVSAGTGFDLDHDMAREFVLKENGTWSGIFHFYESRPHNLFDEVHVLDVSVGDTASFYPGDADGDGRGELTVFGRIVNDFFIRLYESPSAGTYPSQLVWQIEDEWWAVGARIADTDGDGKREIVVAGQTYDLDQRIAVYENTGDNSYGLTFYQAFPALHTSQSMAAANDLDGDGRDEILYGGLVAGGARVYMVESTGDDSYRKIWETELVSNSNGQLSEPRTYTTAAGELRRVA